MERRRACGASEPIMAMCAIVTPTSHDVSVHTVRVQSERRAAHAVGRGSGWTDGGDGARPVVGGRWPAMREAEKARRRSARPSAGLDLESCKDKPPSQRGPGFHSTISQPRSPSPSFPEPSFTRLSCTKGHECWPERPARHILIHNCHT